MIADLVLTAGTVVTGRTRFAADVAIKDGPGPYPGARPPRAAGPHVGAGCAGLGAAGDVHPGDATAGVAPY